MASLKQAIRTGAVETDAVIMLNITGGGIAKFKKENKVVYKQPIVSLHSIQIPIQLKKL